MNIAGFRQHAAWLSAKPAAAALSSPSPSSPPQARQAATAPHQSHTSAEQKTPIRPGHRSASHGLCAHSFRMQFVWFFHPTVPQRRQNRKTSEDYFCFWSWQQISLLLGSGRCRAFHQRKTGGTEHCDSQQPSEQLASLTTTFLTWRCSRSSWFGLQLSLNAII